jgi:hypothetical protein
MSLSKRRTGVSALFDALLFFVMVSVASGALFWGASRISVQAGQGSADVGQQADDIMACALDATVGPVGYSAGGKDLEFSGTGLEGVCEVLRVQVSCKQWNTTALEEALRNDWGMLVDRPYHFALQGMFNGRPGGLLLSDAPGELGGMGGGRWSSSVPLDIDGMEGELTLYIWR